MKQELRILLFFIVFSTGFLFADDTAPPPSEEEVESSEDMDDLDNLFDAPDEDIVVESSDIDHREGL